MKRTEGIGTETLRVPVRARYTIEKKGGSMTRSFDCAELTVKELAEFMARKYGMDLPESIHTETGGDAV